MYSRYWALIKYMTCRYSLPFHGVSFCFLDVLNSKRSFKFLGTLGPNKCLESAVASHQEPRWWSVLCLFLFLSVPLFLFPSFFFYFSLSFSLSVWILSLFLSLSEHLLHIFFPRWLFSLLVYMVEESHFYNYQMHRSYIKTHREWLGAVTLNSRFQRHRISLTQLGSCV